MRTKFAFLSALFLLFVGQVVFAQVTGTVQDGDGFPVSDATVTVRGGEASTTTDENGMFSIAAKVGDVLEVVDLMDVSKDFPVTKNSMGILKFSEAIALAETTIVGAYDRTVTRKESMGATSTISEETFENRATSSFLNSLQGHAPGVVIQSNSGSPGSAQIDVLIRGRGSINASTDPLIVVDGIVIGAAQFRNLNQQDFESVSILRDAHATAIYGNRGANGVIVIKTKSGKSGVPLSIEFSTMYGIFTLPDNDYNMSDAKQMLTIQNRAGNGFGATLTEEEIANWSGPNSDWADVLFKTGINRQYNLGLRQGSDQFRSYFSLSYNDVEGMIPTTDFQRFTVRANLSGNSENKRFEYDSNISVGYSKRNQLDSETNDNISNNVVQNPLFGSVLGLPYLDPYLYSNGQELFDAIGADSSGPGNWAYILKDILVPGQLPNQFTETSILANVSGSYKLTDDLTVRSKVGIDYKHHDRIFARAPWSYLALVVASSAGLEYPGFEDFRNTQDATISSITNLYYDKTFGENHHIQAGLYMEYVKAHYRYNFRRQLGLVPSTWALGAGTGWAPRDGDNYVPTVQAQKIDAGSFSYFGTLDYTYADKYGVGGTFRRDAASKFREDKKWGTFWSAAARWVISEEEFLKNSNTVNMLKLRGSYGVTGNQLISAPGYDTNPLFLDSSTAYDFYSTGPGYLGTGAYLPNVGNVDIGWEETHQSNIGLDFILFDNRLEGNVDVYQKITKQLYTGVGLSAQTGIFEIDGNNGELENKGIELALRYKLFRSNDFNLTLWANTAYNENKITELGTESVVVGSASLAEGHAAYEFFMFEYAGVNSNGYTDGAGTFHEADGALLYYDVNGDLTATPDPDADGKWTGKSLLPKWVGGFGLNVDYKGWYLDLNFSYQAGFYKWDNLMSWLYDATSANTMNLSADLLDAWSVDNPNGSMPALNANYTYDGQSDRLLFDASFIRLRSATFGYNLPKEFLQGTFVKGMNVFVQGENLFLWTKWRGFDPEGQRNFSLGQYPNPRSISLGLNVEF